MSVTLDAYSHDPAYPISLPAEKPGMQGGEELSGDDLRDALDLLGALKASTFSLVGPYLRRHRDPSTRLHKSVLNRYLEPFMWHKVVVSSTSWENFFTQRCAPLAQPEMRIVAEKMREAIAASEPMPVPLAKDELWMWHLPYIDREDIETLVLVCNSFEEILGHLKKISVARCARVSTLHEGEKRDLDEDLAFFKRLMDADPPHWSPLEHVATPCRERSSGHEHLGNFEGWDQLRHLWRSM